MAVLLLTALAAMGTTCHAGGVALMAMHCHVAAGRHPHPWPALLLRGGGESAKVRPGTVDYSKWEQMAGMLSDDDPPGTCAPTVTRLERPGAVTFGSGEYHIESDTEAGGEKEARARVETQDQRRGAKRSHKCAQAVPHTLKGSAAGGLDKQEMARGYEGTTKSVPSRQKPGPGRLDCALELDAYEQDADSANLRQRVQEQDLEALQPEFLEEEDAKIGIPKHMHSTWEHDTKKSECVTSEWDPETRAFRALDYSKWDRLQVSDVDRGSESVAVGGEVSGGGVEEHDEFVCSQVRRSLSQAVHDDNEVALRTALSHAEQLRRVGLMSGEEMEAGQQALNALSSSRSRPPPSPASLVEKTARLAAAAAASLGDGETVRHGQAGGPKGALPSEGERAEHAQAQRVRDKHARAARELLAVLTRNGAATKQALWAQTADDVFIYAFAPEGTRGRDVAVTVKEKWIRISLHHAEPSRGPNCPHPSDTLRPPAPATARPVKAVILCGKLAFRVRVGDGDEADWEVTDVFDASLNPRKAVRVHLRKRPPGTNFVPSSTPSWDPDYNGPGQWQEAIVKLWWNRLLKDDAPIPLDSLPDRNQKRAEEMDKTWAEANEVFKRDVLGMQPVDLSAAFVETAKDKERLRVQDDLCRAGVPEGCAEWDEAMAAADQRAAGFAAKEVAEARAWRDAELAADAEELGKDKEMAWDVDKQYFNQGVDSRWSTPINSQGDEILYGGPYWRPNL